MYRLRRFTILFLLPWFLACGDISYNWSGIDSEPSTDALTACELHTGPALDWCDQEPGCIQGVSLDPLPVEEAMGCATSGLNMASAQWASKQLSGRQDLLAWIAPESLADEQYERSFLTVSADPCGEQTIGGGGWCGYQPSIVRSRIDLAQPFYLQAISADEETLPVRYQLIAPSQWQPSLPRTEVGIDCSSNSLQEGADLLRSVISPQEHYEESISLVPPPALTPQEPWLCDGDDPEWREWGYVLRNQNLLPRLGTIALSSAGESEHPERFNFALLRCGADGRISGDATPLSSGCGVTEGLLDVELEEFDEDLEDTRYVLLLEAPPSAGASVRINIETTPN